MKHFVDTDTAFEKCFQTDEEREQYMYMYSEGDTHYFKHIDTRQYKTISIPS
jgi:translation elongation factor P/translation initiation factor 5A